MAMEIEKKSYVDETKFLEVAKKLEELYGKPNNVEKQDFYYKIGDKSIRFRKVGKSSVWKEATSNDSFILTYKDRSTVGDTEMNNEYEVTLKTDNLETTKQIFGFIGIEKEYNKRKSGFSWKVPLSYNKHPFSLNAELFKVTSDNGYCKYFLEVEYTGDCEVELETDYVTKKINGVFEALNLSDFESKKYATLVLGEVK